jgi:hypothetical protein
MRVHDIRATGRLQDWLAAFTVHFNPEPFGLNETDWQMHVVLRDIVGHAIADNGLTPWAQFDQTMERCDDNQKAVRCAYTLTRLLDMAAVSFGAPPR